MTQQIAFASQMLHRATGGGDDDGDAEGEDEMEGEERMNGEESGEGVGVAIELIELIAATAGGDADV